MSEDLKNLSNENASLQMENETILSTLNLLKLDYEAIQKEMDEAREHFQELDISATKIAHRCEVRFNIHKSVLLSLLYQFNVYMHLTTICTFILE